MLEFKEVSFSYGDKTVLKDFSFSAEEGVSTAILGPSGFGKTTLMELACGFLKPQSGELIPFENKKTSYIFQEDRLLPWRSALENLTALNISEKKAFEYLSAVGLSDSATKYPDELSGGMQRRLAIARALAFGGDLFFFDEPLRGLDMKTSAEILELVGNEIKGKTAFIITHSPVEAFALCERIIVAGGKPFEIKADVSKNDFADAEALSDFLKKVI